MSETDKDGDGGYVVFCGLDVGKAEHHACALDPTGRRLHDKALPNDEATLRQVLNDLGAHGRVLVIVDRAALIGALAVAVARSVHVEVAYLPELDGRLRALGRRWPGGCVSRTPGDGYPGPGRRS